MLDYSWVTIIVLGGAAGFIAEKVMNFDTGLMMNIVLGVVGAIVGSWLFNLLGLNYLEGLLYELVVAVFGACMLILLYRSLRGHSANNS